MEVSVIFGAVHLGACIRAVLMQVTRLAADSPRAITQANGDWGCLDYCHSTNKAVRDAVKDMMGLAPGSRSLVASTHL